MSVSAELWKLESAARVHSRIPRQRLPAFSDGTFSQTILLPGWFAKSLSRRNQVLRPGRFYFSPPIRKRALSSCARRAR